MSKEEFRARGTDSARVIRVIETRALKGNGTDTDPCRELIQYWDFEGNLLAQDDPLNHCVPPAGV